MAHVYQVMDLRSIAPLFQGQNDTLILACLQGLHGHAYADNLQRPKSAKIITADFCFFAGEPSSDLVAHWPQTAGDCLILTPPNPQWDAVIRTHYGNRAKPALRYAIKKEAPDLFDRALLHRIIRHIPDGHTLMMIDRSLYRQIQSLPWAQDLCSQFPTYEDYHANGLGAVLCKDGEVLAGASSYIHYHGGIEVEIDTRSDHRRKGFALRCGAKLILACLERGLYPSWDAANMASVALAEKLGYHFDRTYSIYNVERL